mgnify:CR=1 FL=1
MGVVTVVDGHGKLRDVSQATTPPLSLVAKVKRALVKPVGKMPDALVAPLSRWTRVNSDGEHLDPPMPLGEPHINRRLDSPERCSVQEVRHRRVDGLEVCTGRLRDQGERGSPILPLWLDSRNGENPTLMLGGPRESALR